MEREKKFLLSEQAFLKTGGRLEFGRNLNLIDFEVFEFNLQLLVGLVKSGEKLHKLMSPYIMPGPSLREVTLEQSCYTRSNSKQWLFQIAVEKAEQFAPCLTI